MPFKITRTEEFARDERGSEWFRDFLLSFSGQKTAGIQDVLDMMTNTKGKAVEKLVKSYREQVGLDLVGSDAEDEELTKNAASSIKPIAPMKLKKIENLDDISKDNKPEDLVVQVKLDGFKTSAIKSGGKTEVYTRRGENFTANIPEIIAQLNKTMEDESYIMGELVWENKDGQSSISDIQTVVSSSPEKAHEKIKDGGRVIFYVYDILWENGKEIVDKGYIERYNILNRTIKGLSNIKVVKNYSWAEKDAAMKEALRSGNEGIVIKNKNSKYKYAPMGQNEPHGDQWKYKKGVKAHTDEVILNKYEKGEGKLIFPAFQYKNGELFEVGRLSGLGKEDEEKVKKDIDAGKSVVVEITYQERLESKKFRHMGWSRLRPDKAPKEVKMATFRPISVRQAAEYKSMLAVITNDPKLKEAIESFVRNSGGHKSTYSIINFLREKMGNELVRFTDEELKKYIEDRKEEFKQTKNQGDEDFADVGLVGTDSNEEYHDDVADYFNHGGTSNR